MANELGRIFLSFDKFKGNDGAEVAAELKLHGGKVLQIIGGPQQAIYRSCAKLLWHFEDWMNFLQTSDGVVILSDLNRAPTLYTVDEYDQKTVAARNRPYFEDYTRRWQERPLPSPRPSLPGEQRALMMPMLPPEDSDDKGGV
ncbi:MAG: hypothetical protein HY681_00270 [Chloroflexi bacterium]|nr:hypothetical protein [Chloroflexota bacterium]